jgi:lipopolysaccharide export system permease protein
MKKLDKLILSSFIGPFILTFLVVVFILLTQHMLKYFDDIIGKGLGIDVIGQLLFYFAIFMTPIAMPLAVLLSTLIAFGNLGEHFELTAVKSAGISLVRALFPIFFFVLGLTVIAFYVNNNLVPKAALEAYSLLYDIKQKKPALDLREGSFYDGIPDMSIKVNKKYPDGVTIADVLIYDHRKHDGNREVTVADSGKMYTILNERYLKLELFNGYNYTEGANNNVEIAGQSKSDQKESYTRTKFSKTQVVFDLSSFALERTDKKWFQGNRIMRNMSELENDIDSIDHEVLRMRLAYYTESRALFSYYSVESFLKIPDELLRFKAWQDSLPKEGTIVPIVSETGLSAGDTVKKSSDSLRSASTIGQKPVRDTVSANASNPISANAGNRKATSARPKGSGDALRRKLDRMENARRRFQDKAPLQGEPVAAARRGIKKEVLTEAQLTAKIDSLFKRQTDKSNFESAANTARSGKTQLENSEVSMEEYSSDRRVFLIQWHKILASSLACVVMFLIGAPLGAIIKKGGLGVPFLVSIFFFIVYYLFTMTGEKWAKQGIISVPVGVWAGDVILFVVGLLFLRQARLDARLFEADFYMVILDRAKKWLIRKKILPAPEV